MEARHSYPHPRRPRGSQSGREKGRDESFRCFPKSLILSGQVKCISNKESIIFKKLGFSIA